MRTWQDAWHEEKRRAALQRVRERLHDAIYFDKPLTGERLRDLARTVDDALELR